MDIPLFPLPSLVLFPNVIIPLHIFEERYKLMINACIDNAEAFGVILLREGATEENDETIHQVGVTVRIMQVERLNDGRMNILCEGESRFRVDRFTQRVPFWRGKVEFFEDDDDDPEHLEPLYDQVSTLYKKVFDLGIELGIISDTQLALPDSPSKLSYMISYLLDIDAEDKQRLLEMTSTGLRLETLVEHLHNTVQKLEQQIAYRKILSKVRGNGDLGKPADGQP